MAVMQMQRISICALKQHRKAILEKLQAMGIIELTDALTEDTYFHRMDTVNDRILFEKTASMSDRSLDILEGYAPEKKGLLSALEGKTLVEAEVQEDVVRRKDELLEIVRRIQALDKENAECKAEILKLENTIQSLVPWLKLDVPMKAQETEYTSMIFGTLPGNMNLESIYAAVAAGLSEDSHLKIGAGEDTGGWDIDIISSGQDQTCIAVVTLKDLAEAVEDSLRSRGFSRASQEWTETPSEACKALEGKIRKYRERMEEIKKQLLALSEYREQIKLLADYYRMRADRYEVLGEIPQSESTFIVSGYIPEKYVPELRKALEDKYDCVIDIEEPQADEDIPVLLSNNSFSRSAEGILESFGLPGKGEIDPTMIMSCFYVFLFGLMLSDAAYGAIVSIACGAALLKFPRMADGMKKSLQLFFWCGLSTLFWGILFGGYFGDVVNVVSRTFFGHEVSIPALWFVPLNDPMRLLIYSMVFGLIHLFTGLGIKGYMYIRDKKYLDCICDVGLWYVFLIGLLIMLIPSEIFASIAQMEIIFPEPVNMLGKVMAAVGAVGIVLMSGRANKNFGLRIALGAYDLYNVTGWLSDILSYSRLLALGLATGVIAQVVNQMGSMFGTSIFGVIGFIVVFIIGHTLNLAINLLGAYVHTNRLQYVEFFGKFYEGTGRPFNPFKEHTKYADIKEETRL